MTAADKRYGLVQITGEKNPYPAPPHTSAEADQRAISHRRVLDAAWEGLMRAMTTRNYVSVVIQHRPCIEAALRLVWDEEFMASVAEASDGVHEDQS